MTNAESGRKAGWYHGWNIVGVCILAGIAASSLPTTGFSLFLGGWATDLHVPFSTLTLGITLFALGCAVLSPFTGVLTDKFPARTILAWGIGGVAVSCIAMSYVTHIWQYMLLYAVPLPVAVLASTTIPSNAVVMRWFVKRLGLALGLTSMGLSMAGIVMPPVVAALMPELGWRMIWRLAGIFIGVVVLPLVILVVRERPSERDGTYYLTADGASGPAPSHGHGGAGGEVQTLRWGAILARRNFWLLVVAYISMLILYGGAGYNLSPIGASHGLGVEWSSYLISAWALAQAAATLGSGMLSDKFGNRMPLVGLALLTALGGVVISFGASFPVLLVGAALTGLGGGFWPLIASVLAKDYGAAGFGRAFGTLLLFLPFGSLPSFIVAKSKENLGSYAPALLGMAVLAVIGGLACLFIREKHGSHVTAQEKTAVEEAAVPLL